MYLLMGLAGSGKGTQGELLAEKIGYKYLSTGEYLRSYVTAQRKQEMLAGKLISDQEMIDIITSFLESLASKNNCILDGFPRTLEQAKWLLEKSHSQDFDIEGLIYLEVTEAELIDRLLKRGRADDTKSAIKRRFELYRQSTEPVIDYYRSQSVPVFEIPGNNGVEEVQKSIQKQIKWA